ncbi:MAG: DUF2279 domain-containing protein, partial [Flavobacteriales bacterium]|nr:DUF2279 domain-containing protein [Flavobacteriales bacterium]
MVCGRTVIGFLLALCSIVAHAQPLDSTGNRTLDPGRAWLVAGGTAASMAGSLFALDRAWYQGHDRIGFHSFDDGDEWYQVDKLGHAHSAFQLGRAGHATFAWAGFNERTSVWLGGSVGFIYLTGIEYLDGFSSAYGFSWWDMGANT